MAWLPTYLAFTMYSLIMLAANRFDWRPFFPCDLQYQNKLHYIVESIPKLSSAHTDKNYACRRRYSPYRPLILQEHVIKNYVQQGERDTPTPEPKSD
eukprot:933857-Pelagomonas_calceolata.AAC.2